MLMGSSSESEQSIPAEIPPEYEEWPFITNDDDNHERGNNSMRQTHQQESRQGLLEEEPGPARRLRGGEPRGRVNDEDEELMYDDLDELKGCLDLGFGFSYDEIPELCNTLPALELCYSMTQRSLDEQQQQQGRSPEVSPVPAVWSPVASWRISAPAFIYHKMWFGRQTALPVVFGGENIKYENILRVTIRKQSRQGSRFGHRSYPGYGPGFAEEKQFLLEIDQTLANAYSSRGELREDGAVVEKKGSIHSVGGFGSSPLFHCNHSLLHSSLCCHDFCSETAISEAEKAQLFLDEMRFKCKTHGFRTLGRALSCFDTMMGFRPLPSIADFNLLLGDHCPDGALC
ncbi:hypothetical protein CDL15_Pgr019873 [Punica granatum]|uniref:Uncharacterized protein n=1 Tax=Punica granatum TaxID=22663 RepID=A0A218W4D7_PUNGR|nr:hypothetical protein CDL15_Pgr019873 [Punica granatum]